MYKEKPLDKLDDMPYYKILREYKCEGCEEHSYEIVKKSVMRRKTKCPHCGKNKLDSYIEKAPEGRVKGQNVGSLAEQNTKKLGRYERESRTNELEKNDHRNLNTKTRKHTERMRKIGKLQGEQKKKFLRGELDV